MGSITTTFHDVLDPLSGVRRSVRWSGGSFLGTADSFPSGQGRDLDGSAFWLLPPLYDADAHTPFIPFGIRHTDAGRALAGGIAQFNLALPWELARGFALADVVTELGRSTLPRIIPLLSVSPEEESAGFPTWLGDHIEEVRALLPPVCKLYSYDPNFERNLDAVWGAGLKPMVWCNSEAHLEKLVARAGDLPLHHRHATSAQMVGVMRRATRATLQTCPHFLLRLADGKRQSLVVLPPPLPPEHSVSLTAIFLDAVDLVVTDHNAPPMLGAPTGPGLQTQQHFLQTLLTLAELHAWPLARLLEKATTAPANLFGTTPPEGFLLVDPNGGGPAERWPGQGADRAPFEGLALKGRVLAIGGAGQVELL